MSTTKEESWPMLLAIAAVIIGPLCFLQYNVVYTEGEVMQGLFRWLLIGLMVNCILIGFISRKAAIWVVILVGGSLLLWQTYQARKWAMIHEDVVAIVRFAEESKTRTGHFPSSLDGYTFKSSWVKSHVCNFGADETNGLRISYFMNDRGITYWYSSMTGFGYHPD